MNLTITKLNEIEARLRSLAASILGVLPEQSGNSGKFLKTDGAAASWDTPVGGGGGNALYVQEGGAAEGDSSAADLTLDFAGADFDITTAAGTCSISVADGGIDHGSLAGLADIADHTGYLAVDGTRPLTGNWDAGSYEVRAQTFESDVATGTAPVVVASTTKVANLNADLLDGYEEAAFVRVKGPWLVGNYAVHTDSANELQQSIVTSTELGRLSGVTGDIQTQINTKAATSSVVLRDGTQALTADWDAGSFEVRAQTFESDVATGTEPLTIASTTACTNLNADLLDGNHAAAFAVAAAGVTNGDSHDHSGGDGAQIDHGGLGGLSDNDHPQYALATGHVYAVKTADQTINNSDVYADDTHLQGLSLAASSKYRIEMLLLLNTTTDTPDYKFRIVSSQSDWAMTAAFSTVADTTQTTSSTTAWTYGVIAIRGGATRAVNLFGKIETTTACTIKLQWAQNTATAENSKILSGSHILLHKLA